MNLFETVFLYVILLIFPVLIYYIYLFTNKNITEKSKRIYLRLTFITSFFLVYNYGINNKLIAILIISSLVIFSYLEDLYIFANVLLILLMISYYNVFNNIIFILIGYILVGVLYLFKKQKNIVFIQISILINSVTYYLWIYFYNSSFLDNISMIEIIIGYAFIMSIICLMYETGKNILAVHMNYKELQQEKQIRLSLFKITHEIKNPIAVCKGYLDMLNTNNQKQVEKYIPIIKSEIERLLSILQDFLLINKTNLDLDIMDFNLLIEDTINKLNPLLKENNIKLKLNIIDDEVFINGDYNRLSQVLINIIKNSIEAMSCVDNKKIKITTSIKNNNYNLIVEDNGIGINKNILKKIKEPFFTTKNRGSGLGVALIYEIIEAHSGSVNYTSEEGKGTKVTVKIPLYE